MNTKSVILLHGWGLSGEKFQPLAKALTRKGYTVLAPDLPGFGKSMPPPASVGLSYYVNFLHDYMREKAIIKPILIGHSFGGRVALKYQYTYPDSIQALILTGTPGYTPVPRRRLAFFIAIAKFGKILSMLPPFCFFQKDIRNWYYYIVGARDYYRATPVMRQTFKNVVGESLTQYMKGVRVPCALVWGSDDQITPIWIAKRMKEVIPKSKLIIIQDTGHSVSYKQPEVFVDSIKGFLKDITK